MSELNELIQELSSNGVEYKFLNEIAHYAKGRINVSEINKETYVGVENLLPNKEGKTAARYVPTEGNVIAFRVGDILIGNIRPYLRKIWLADRDGGTNGDVLVVQLNSVEQIMPRFLYYVMSSEHFFSYDVQNSKGAKMPRGDKEAVLKYKVPVPQLEVQREIVRILDNFTELTTELIIELTRELAARKKQYEFYRNKLLTFNSKISFLTIEEICNNIVSGGTPKSGNGDYYGGDIPWLRTQEIDWQDIYKTSMSITEKGFNNSSAKWIPANCVIVAMYGATAAKVAINKTPLTTNQACCNLEIDETKALYKYVFYWLCKEYYSLKALGQGSQSNINLQTIKKFKIAVPPLTMQRHIVDVLDKLDAICTDLNIALFAEIETRQKQYEYYCDKLLTFKELSE